MTPAHRIADDLRPDTPAHEAAAAVLRAFLRPLPRAVERASAEGRKNSAEDVHHLRVATRRAEAALHVFDGIVPAKPATKMRRRLKRLRRAAGRARDCDTAAVTLAALGTNLTPAEAAAAEAALAQFRADGRRARRDLARAAKRDTPRKLRRGRRKLLRRIDDGEPGRRPLSEVLDAAAAGALDAVRSAAAANLSDLGALHTLRLRIKRLRYTMELIDACTAAPGAAGAVASPAAAAVECLTTIQDQLGALNDAAHLAGRLADMARSASDPTLAAGLAALAARARARVADLHAAFLRDWPRERIDSVLGDPVVASPGALSADHAAPAQPGTPNGAHRPATRHIAPEVPPRDPRRIAAIDVGTNSIRLIVAEMDELEPGSPDAGPGGYRILDDEKEVARLGRGLEATGRMDPAAMERAAAVVAQMRGIADGYGVDRLRVVGTAVVRDAENGEEFRRLVRERAGVDLEVISAEEEARLAFLSASHAFDLAGAPTAVVDIGGGSTEVILAASGVLDRIYTVPLGAVRLTERFGGAESAARDRFDDMTRAVRREFKEHIGKPPFVPAVLVGTGGTFAALGSIALHAELGPAVDGLFSGSVQGYEVRRWEVRHLLDYLRKLPPREREHVGGLSPDRADIIVAGLTIIEGLMRHLRVNTARVHEGGIRDGLLLQMIGFGPAGASPGSGSARDPLRSIMRFARACGYEQRHCRHVAMLATQIFDRLAAEAEAGRFPDEAVAGIFTPRNRLLLEAAAIVHDVGYLVNYAGHHKHSYHLIAHADLPGFTAREIEVIANVARYHRRAEPSESHAHFARLPQSDRRTVLALSAILRVADGLDRTHMQRVRAVRVAPAESGRIRLLLEAEREPSVDIWGATRKAALFERCFGLTPIFEWTLPGEPAAHDVRPADPAAVPLT